MEGKIFQLKDGRQLGYKEYGDKEGIPVMVFHGTPGSKFWYSEDDEHAHSLGVRIISTDRPGFGTSDKMANRSLLDWPNDLLELADGLGLDQFSVIGVSGGGAYAAACAYTIAHRLSHVSMVSSVAPFKNGKPPKSMLKENRIAFALCKYAPWLVNYSYKLQKKLMEQKPEKFIAEVKKGNKHLNEGDRQYIQTDEQIKDMMVHLKGAFLIRVDGVVEELILLAKPWGFEFKDIDIPIHIWHGESDRMAPFEEIENVARALPQPIKHFVPKAGHFLIDDETIWRNILEVIKEDHVNNVKM